METLQFIKQHGGFIRAKSVKADRSLYDQLLVEVGRGNVVRLRQGIYALADELAKPMIDVETVVPGGVLCMYSAWAHYGLTTKLPPAICIAIDKARKVTLPPYPPISLYFWTTTALELGVTQQVIDGHAMQVYDLEKSVCDAVRFRHKIGTDVCSEIVRAYLCRPDRNLTRLHAYASQLRVATTMRTLIDYML